MALARDPLWFHQNRAGLNPVAAEVARAVARLRTPRMVWISMLVSAGSPE